MANKIKIEGQTINGESVGITDEIANDDELLKAALAPTWPDVRTATISRSGGTDGKELVVTVTKKAGTKGVNNVVEVKDARERLAEREAAEAERVRKLEDLALAAGRFLSSWWDFRRLPPIDLLAAVMKDVDGLDDAFDAIGVDEIARIRKERRGL